MFFFLLWPEGWSAVQDAFGGTSGSAALAFIVVDLGLYALED
jgi:hypothetical protein